jgi:LmbE family N-acetylglucosaminyl deacetylase
LDRNDRVLVVAAHGDDEMLGCGATIASHRRRGDPVSILILGEGITARYGRRADAPRKELAKLQSMIRRAARAVGVQDVETHSFPDNRFDSVPLLEITQRIESTMKRVRPTIVYTHHEGDLNIDHERTCRAVLAAVRPVPGSGVRAVYAFEVASSTEWRASAAKAFVPRRYVDVAATLSKKLAALRCYGSEMRPFPHARSYEGIRALAARRGSEAGVRAAEAFDVLREVVTGPRGR